MRARIDGGSRRLPASRLNIRGQELSAMPQVADCFGSTLFDALAFSNTRLDIQTGE